MRIPDMIPRVLIALTLLIPGTSGAAPQARPWLQYVSPEEAGFSSQALEEARKFADTGKSAAVLAVYKGRVLAAWGDVHREIGLHSVRKSLVSALFGIAAGEGKINLEATLEELGIDDEPLPLTAAEKKARVRDLLAARSGVYLPAAYAPSDQDTERPARGSFAPGTHWFYNNWDFNVLGVIYERLTGLSPYQAFFNRIAGPLGMEDWSPEDGLLVYEPGQSSHPAHTFRMSTRDLARFGQLYLQGGKWNGAQIVPEAWVRESTQPVSETGPGRGYGFLWWTYKAGSFGERYGALDKYDVFTGTGSGGQLVAVIPALDLVVVHRGDTDNNRAIGGGQAWTIIARIVAARTGQAAENPRLGPLTTVPLSSQLPAAVEPDFVQLPQEVMREYLGAYEFGKGEPIRVFAWRGRTFADFPGEGEAELFALAKDSFTILVQPGVKIDFLRDAAGKVTGAFARMGEREIRAVKRESPPQIS